MPFARADNRKYFSLLWVSIALAVFGFVSGFVISRWLWLLTPVPILSLPFVGLWADHCLVHWGRTQEEADAKAAGERAEVTK